MPWRTSSSSTPSPVGLSSRSTPSFPRFCSEPTAAKSRRSSSKKTCPASSPKETSSPGSTRRASIRPGDARPPCPPLSHQTPPGPFPRLKTEEPPRPGRNGDSPGLPSLDGQSNGPTDLGSCADRNNLPEPTFSQAPSGPTGPLRGRPGISPVPRQAGGEKSRRRRQGTGYPSSDGGVAWQEARGNRGREKVRRHRD